jgi:dTDP-glucose 4,6-dehydratase
MKILVTGGSGFIGSTLIKHILETTQDEVFNVDRLSYAASPITLSSIEHYKRYAWQSIDIRDPHSLKFAFKNFEPDAVIHLAAETHVDNSIAGPEVFMQTNIMGTFNLLQATLEYYNSLPDINKNIFKFHHVSTDEVFGDLLYCDTRRFDEDSPYKPSSPYSASKAASDHLVRAWGRTYGLPVVISNTTNNYGPFQHPEKLIPKTIINAILGKPIIVYGTGNNIRDWIHVEDHAVALLKVLEEGLIGKTYCIGARNAYPNLVLIMTICSILDAMWGLDKGTTAKTIQYVKDRAGHDNRYEIDPTFAEEDLGWKPTIGFDKGIEDTVQWYINNRDWWENKV